jgi:hypothetical protein
MNSSRMGRDSSRILLRDVIVAIVAVGDRYWGYEDNDY